MLSLADNAVAAAHLEYHSNTRAAPIAIENGRLEHCVLRAWNEDSEARELDATMETMQVLNIAGLKWEKGGMIASETMARSDNFEILY